MTPTAGQVWIRFVEEAGWASDGPHRYRRHEPPVLQPGGPPLQADHEGECERDERLRCVCPGFSLPACCARASQEDRLCDDCREHCHGLDGVRYIDRYGPAR